MQFVRRLLLVLLGVAIVGAIVYALLPQPVEVDLALVSRGPMQVGIQEDGKTRIRERYVVSAPLAGRLSRIDMNPGDTLAAGVTLLATIEPSDPELLNPRELAAAEARKKAAEAALKRAGPLLAESRAQLEFAESELARHRKLAQTRAVSASELAASELLYRTRAEEFRSATFAEEIAQYELEQAAAALLRTRGAPGNGAEDSEYSDAHFEIRSPIDGHVLRVFQESASVVTPGTPLLEVGDPQDLELEIDVLSTDAVKIHPGDEVIIEHWGGPRPLLGVVRVVEPSAFTKISALGVEEQRVNVIVDLLDPPEQRQTLGDGFRIEANTIIWRSDSELRVPASALFRQGDEWAVFVARDGRARLKKIKIGQRNDTEAQVLDGLSANDQVIVHPGDQIRDGVRIAARIL